MGLYNQNINKLDVNLAKYSEFDLGSTSKILRCNDKIAKVYFEDTRGRIKEEVFNVLSTIKNNHFIKLYDIFTILNDEEAESDKELYLNNMFRYRVDGYIAKYYEKENINPLNENSSYMLRVIYQLKEVFDILSKKGIRVFDLSISNIVLSRSGVVIIDPDLYELSKMKKEVLKEENNYELLYFLKYMFMYYSNYSRDCYTYLLKLNGKKSDDAINTIESDLRRVKTTNRIFK